MKPCVVEKAEAKPAEPAAAAAASADPVKADVAAKADAPAETDTIDVKNEQLIRALTFEDEVGDPMKVNIVTCLFIVTFNAYATHCFLPSLNTTHWP